MNRLTDLDHADSVDTTLAFYDFEYDSASRITAITDTDGRSDYAYDDRDQLIGADRGESDSRGDESYEFDANGNRTNSSLHDDGYVTGPGNHLLSDSTFDYEYDAEGNMILRTRITTDEFREFDYDHRNRLVLVTDFSSGGVILQEVEYAYDAVDRRMGKTVDADGTGPTGEHATRFVYDRDNILLDFIDADGSGIAEQPVLITRYLFGPGVDQVLAQEDVVAGQTLWLLADHLGTVHDIINDSGALSNHILYDSFGNVLYQTDSTVTIRYLFTGREFDTETELYYYRTRFYDANMGRFVSEDPIRWNSGDVNLYRYVQNNSQNATDPTGNIVILVTFRRPIENWLRRIHYSRNSRNNHPQSETEALGSGRWRLLPWWQAHYHQWNDGRGNRKYVSLDGHGEAVFDECGRPDTTAENMATYNVFDPDLIWGVPHFVADVFPYWYFGNSSDDTTSPLDRILGLRPADYFKKTILRTDITRFDILSYTK